MGAESVADTTTDPVDDAQPRAEALVEARGLRKSYGAVEAVRGIDVTVHRGEAFGFLGPNGAGKSSTMRMIAAVSTATAGSLRVLGLDPATDGPAIRARLGVCPQDNTLDSELTVRENLLVYGRFFGLTRPEVAKRADELLAFVQLSDKSGARVEELSGGLKRRLTVARSLINDPELLMLDEPTTGLDPQARHLLWDRLFRLKQGGTTLLITTHYMDEAEQLCDRLMVIDEGVIVAEGSPVELIRAHSSREVCELRFGVDDDLAALAERFEHLAERVEALPDRVLVYASDGEQVVHAVHGMGLRPRSTLVRRGTLEDVFLRLTGRSLAD